MHYLLRNIPSHKDTGEERSHRHEPLCREIIATVEKRLAKEGEFGNRTTRQGTEDTYHTTSHRLYPGSTTAGDMHLLIEESRTYLVHGDGRGKRRQHKQGIEKHRDDITHHRHGSKSLIEHIGQGDEDKRRTAVGLHAHGECCRKNHQSCQDGYQRIEESYLCGSLEKIGLTAEVEA